MGTFSTWGKNAKLNGLPNTLYAQSHSADPGPAGADAVNPGVARIAVPLAAAANGERLPQSGTYQFDMLAGQTQAWVSYWDASSGGNFVAKDDTPVETFANAGKYTLTTQSFKDLDPA